MGDVAFADTGLGGVLNDRKAGIVTDDEKTLSGRAVM